MTSAKTAVGRNTVTGDAETLHSGGVAQLDPRAMTRGLADPNYRRGQQVIKRGMDIALSLVGLIFLAPVFAVAAMLVKLTSSGPILYRWRVVGRNGRYFTAFKFRSMVENADAMKDKLMAGNEMEGPVFKLTRDPRVTPVGRFLRKLSIDELPQLWSVLKGDMSLVGPRPPLQTEWTQFSDAQRRKLAVKPGITCLWQISGRNSIRKFDDWVKFDLQYIENWSLWLDLRILLKTIPAVLSGKGAS